MDETPPPGEDNNGKATKVTTDFHVNTSTG